MLCFASGLVSARGLLHQSKTTFEALDVNTVTG